MTMTESRRKDDGRDNRNADLPEIKEIYSPEAVPILFHEKKQEILRLLVIRDMTIIDLKNETKGKENPGTIKRHLNDLVRHGLVMLTAMEPNEYGILMKYYRATAKSFRINIKWTP